MHPLARRSTRPEANQARLRPVRRGAGGRRRRDAALQGSATLEAVAALSLLLLTMTAIWQAVVWLQVRGQAETDARTLARLAVLCPTPADGLTLASIHETARGDVSVMDNGDSTRSVTVWLAPTVVVPQLADLAWPSSTVTMHVEPC